MMPEPDDRAARAGESFAELPSRSRATAKGLGPESEASVRRGLYRLRRRVREQDLTQPERRTAAVGNGLGSEALLLYEGGRLLGDPTMLAEALALSEAGLGAAAQPERRPDCSEEERRHERLGRSLLFASPGLHVVRGAAAAALDRGRVYEDSCRCLEAAIRLPEVPDVEEADVFLGRAGLLAGGALLLRRGAETGLPAGNLSATIADEVAAAAGRLKPELAEGQKLGLAHGRAGVLTVIFDWYSFVGEPPPQVAVDALEVLLDAGVRSARRIYWPREAQGSEFWAGICNGTAGVASLIVSARHVLPPQRRDAILERIAEALAPCDSEENLSLCCGQAGIAVALGQCASALQRPEYLGEARRKLSTAQALQGVGLLQGEDGVLFAEMRLQGGGPIPLTTLGS
jgi:hypothetical protein